MINIEKLKAKYHPLLQSLVDDLSGAALPTLYFQPKGLGQHVVKRIHQLNEKYRPTPWLTNTHFHMLFFDLVKKKTINFKYDSTEILTMRDGGQTALVWAGYHLPPHVPTVVVMHTITGTPESMSELVQDIQQHTGWRVVLCLRRGHADLPLTVPKINILGSTDDLREQLAVIQQRFPQSLLYSIGSSAGSGLLIRYLGEEGSKSRIKAAFAYCPGYNTDEAFSKAHQVYSRLMVKRLIKQFVAPHLDKLTHLSTLQALRNAQDLAAFQANIYELAGFSSYEAYSQASNPMRVFKDIKVPLMVLNAEDDLLCRIENVYPYLDDIQHMPNVVLVTTPKGSHCAYYEGWQATSWAGRLMANYFKAVSELGDTKKTRQPKAPAA